MKDTLLRFVSRDAPVRGEIVSLDDAWLEVAHRHRFPECVRDRLGELSAAALLLASTLKFDGALVLQIHGDGPVALLVVECDATGSFRATAKLRDDAPIPENALFGELVNAGGQGRFVVTLDPRAATGQRQPYQGIVPFDGDTVSDVLEHYMVRSEQLPTRLWLACDGQRSVGLLLQRMPDTGGRSPAATDEDTWQRLTMLADTVTHDELLHLSPMDVLERLFHQEPLDGLTPRDCRFSCSCTREKVAGMLRMLGADEVRSIVHERGDVDVHCEFCNQGFRFDPVDCEALFVSGVSPSATRPQ